MRPGFDLELDVHYGFVNLASPGASLGNLTGARAGQRNGICGAVFAGVLSMLTGLHTGKVPFRFELWDSEPAVDDLWEDVVEVNFVPQDTELSLSTFESSDTIVLPTRTNHRARYCALGMDQAREQDTRLDGDQVIDRYQLALWLAEPAPELVLRQTSVLAAYWAGVAADTPPPAAPANSV